MKNKILHQNKVSHDAATNEALSDGQRLANLEHDMILMTESIVKLVDQNSKFTDYLDQCIKNEKEAHELRMEIKKKLITSTIWSIMGALTIAVLFTVKEWINH